MWPLLPLEGGSPFYGWPLRDDEIAAITERANEGRARIGTTAEHHDGQGA
jgi:hypothetical protein